LYIQDTVVNTCQHHSSIEQSINCRGCCHQFAKASALLKNDFNKKLKAKIVTIAGLRNFEVFVHYIGVSQLAVQMA